MLRRCVPLRVRDAGYRGLDAQERGWHEGSGNMGAHACTTYMLMRRQIARFYSLVARVDWEYGRER